MCNLISTSHTPSFDSFEGWVPNSVLLRVQTELHRYYKVPIHIKPFDTKFRYLRTHLGTHRREREHLCAHTREKGRAFGCAYERERGRAFGCAYERERGRAFGCAYERERGRAFGCAYERESIWVRNLRIRERERESIWARIREREIERALGRAYWWWLRRGPSPPHDCKALWVYNNTQSAI